MFSDQVALARQQMPVPFRVAALALLWAYREANVPLSYQTASDWYSVGGRWWRRVWTTCGFLKQGDKFYGAKSLAWGEPLSLAEATALWDDMTALAHASDEWQLAQGQDVPAPVVDVGALVARSVSWGDRLTTINPAWEWGQEHRAATPRKLVAILKEAAKKLDEWYKRRFPGRPPLPPPMPSVDGGAALLLLAGLGLLMLAGGGRRRTTTRTRRRR